MFVRLKTHLMAALTLVLLSSSLVSANTSEAVLKIERFNETLRTILENSQSLKFNGRYETLAPVMLDSFDMNFMAKFSAGKHWRSLTPNNQKRLVKAFSRLWISTYADRFVGYNGEHFEIKSSVKAPRNTLLVKTHIIKKSGKKTAIDYLMREKADTWSVIDIFLKGRFSELAKQRAEYTSILKRNGIEGVVTIVEDKVRQMQERGN